MREPRQVRSRETLERIVVATLETARLSIDGDIKLRDVAQAAGISQGTLHTRFPSKDALLRYVHTRFWDDRLALLESFLTRALDHARAPRSVGPRVHMRPLLEEGLTLLAEDLQSTRAITKVFELALVDSWHLANQHRERVHEALTLLRTRAEEIMRALGQELDRERFMWTSRLAIAGLEKPHQSLAQADLQLSDEAVRIGLVELLLGLFPAE